MSGLEDLFAQIENEPIPGGCDLCDAYQAVVTLSPGVHSLTVHHDDWCPVLRVARAEAN
jgi:hypothetical protein